MKETGIIMSGNHPQLILDGAKTMTRRTWGLEKVNKNPDDWQLVAAFEGGEARFYNRKTEEDITLKCPYGGVGDWLWMKETFGYGHYADLPCIIYKSDGNRQMYGGSPHGDKIIDIALTEQYDGHFRWRPSIFMPKKFARIWRQITEGRAERLQEITEEDAKAEGITWGKGDYYRTHRMNFGVLWDSLNAKRGYGWDSNPWNWVISFRRLEL